VEAVKEFTAWKDEFMKRTVWAQDCKSWYKSGNDGPIVALWPGSALHYTETLKEAVWRGDDWDVQWKKAEGTKGGRWGWLGDGYSQCEKDGTADWGWYIRDFDDGEFASRGKRRKIRNRSGMYRNGGLGDKQPATA